MSRNRWSEVKELFEATLDTEPDKRSEFLTRRCLHDQGLRLAVERLLDGNQRANNDRFLEVSAWSYDPVEGDDELTTGLRIGAYRVLKKIPGGGMGLIYLAERADGAFQQKVVIKVVKRDLEKDEVKRFEQERQILASLNHPNIAHLKDGGRLADGRPFLVMEYIEGASLREIMRSRGPLPIIEVVNYAKQICAALGFAHKRKIIHRDIKPENIMVSSLDDESVIKVLDFGIAVLKDPGPGLTRDYTNGIIGTPKYMSPEQAGGVFRDLIDGRSDIYSIALIVYEMLTGESVFSGDDLSVWNKHLNEDPLPMRVRRPELEIPEALDKLILSALRKNPADRPQTVDDFAMRISLASDGNLAGATTELINQAWSAPTTAPIDQTRETLEATDAGQQRIENEYATRMFDPPVDIERKKPANKRPYILAIAGVVLLSLAGYVIVSRMQRDIPPSVEAPTSNNTPNQLSNPSNSGKPANDPSTMPAKPSRSSGNADADTPKLVTELFSKGTDGSPVRASTGQVFHSGDAVRLAVTPSQDGFLYIVQKGSSGRWNIIFPDYRINQGKTSVAAGRQVQIPSKASDWMKFDKNSGTETVYAILASDNDDDLLKTILAASRTDASDGLRNALATKLESQTGSNTRPAVVRWELKHER